MNNRPVKRERRLWEGFYCTLQRNEGKLDEEDQRVRILIFFFFSCSSPYISCFVSPKGPLVKSKGPHFSFSFSTRTPFSFSFYLSPHLSLLCSNFQDPLLSQISILICLVTPPIPSTHQQPVFHVHFSCLTAAPWARGCWREVGGGGVVAISQAPLVCYRARGGRGVADPRGSQLHVSSVLLRILSFLCMLLMAS